jgi:hypothetical protein
VEVVSGMTELTSWDVSHNLELCSPDASQQGAFC